MRNRDLAFQLRGIAKSDRVNHQEKRVLNEAAARIHPWARLLDYRDLAKSEGTLWVEFRNGERGLPSAAVLGFVVKSGEMGILFALRDRPENIWLVETAYNFSWRCWRGRPSEEQMQEEWG